MSVPAAYISVIVIWSTTPLAIKWSAEGAGFLLGVFGRMAIGAVVCLVLLRLLHIPLPWHREARQTYMAGAIGVYGAMLSVYWGAQFIPSGLISVVFGLTPIMTGAFASVWLSEQSFTPPKVAGMLLGLGGLAVIFGTGAEMGDGALAGIAAMLLAVSLHSVSTVWVKRVAGDVHALSITAGTLLLSVPLYFVTWLAFEGALPEDVPTRAVLSILYLGIFGSVVGFVLFFFVLKHIEAGRIALIPLIPPVTALMIGRSYNDEHVGVEVWLGTALILAGLVLYQWGGRLRRRFAS